MTTAAQDTFTDTNGTNLTSHTSDSGHSWTHQSGYTQNHQIQSNSVAGGPATSVYISRYVPPSADYDVTAISFHPTGSYSGGPVGRADPYSQNSYQVQYAAGGSNEWVLYKEVAGVFTSIGSYAGAAPSTPREIRLSFVGTTIKVYVDGVERISVTDSTFTSGRPGALVLDTGHTLDSWSLDVTNATGIEYVSSSRGTTNGLASTIASAALNVTATNALVVAVTSTQSSSNTVSSVTDTAGNTYAPLTALDFSGAFAQLFIARNCLGNAANVVTVNFSGSVDDPAVEQVQFSGLDSAATILIDEASGTAVSGTDAISGTLLAAGLDCLIVAAAASTNDRTWAQNAGFTELYDSFADGGSAGSAHFQFKIASAQASQTVGAIASSSTNGVIVAAALRVAWPYTFVSDAFDGTAASTLQSHSAPVGGSWSQGVASTGNINLNGAGGIYDPVGNNVWYYNAGNPATNEYVVEAVVAISTNGSCGICGRMSASANDRYEAFWHSSGEWRLNKVVAGVTTNLGSYAGDSPTTARALRLELRDAAKKLFVGGVERISSADNSISAAGKAGVKGDGFGSSAATISGFVAAAPWFASATPYNLLTAGSKIISHGGKLLRFA